MLSRFPLIDVVGSLFPIWMPCMAAAILLTLAVRYLLVRAGLDTEIGPRFLIYPSMAVLWACAIWLVIFNY